MVVPLSAAGAATLVFVIKLLIARPRPTTGAVVATASGFSFPSGHSTQGIATYDALAWTITRTTVVGRGRRVAVWLAAGTIALLIGLSRLYLGVHWLSDVVGGWVLATAWLASTIIAVTARAR